MSKFYSNNFQEIVESFSEQKKELTKLSTDEIKNHLNNLINKVKNKELSKSDLHNHIEKLRDLKNKKETSDEIKTHINKFIYESRKHAGGMKLQGNLELGGVMTSKGYYLTDGTKINEIEKIVDKLAVPVDKEGNINLKTKGNKKINITGEVNFNDTRKGVTIHNGRHGNYNRHGRPTHFNLGGQGINYIGGRTHMNGEVQFNDNTKGVYISNGKHRHYNRDGRNTYFNHGGRGYNSIGGTTHMHGEVRLTDTTKGLYIDNSKNNWNKNGAQTYFNQGGYNRISGLTFLNGTIHSSNKDSGIYIQNAKNGNNPNGRSTSFNYGGSGSNHIGGTTRLTGPTITVNSNNFNVNSNRFLVNAHRRTSSFGSHSSGWCHITTTAPQFWMNKGLQVNGHIRGYSNKPINADRGVHAPHLSRVGGDWLRINNVGNSVGRTAIYGGVSIHENRHGRGGLGVGYWGHPGHGNIKATGSIEGNKVCITHGGEKYCIDIEMMKKIKSKVKEKKENVDEKIKSVINNELGKLKLELKKEIKIVKIPDTVTQYYKADLAEIFSNSKKFEVSFTLNVNRFRSLYYNRVNLYSYFDRRGRYNSLGMDMYNYRITYSVPHLYGSSISHKKYWFDIPTHLRKDNININIRTVFEIKKDNRNNTYTYIVNYINNAIPGNGYAKIQISYPFYIVPSWTFHKKLGVVNWLSKYFDVKNIVIKKLD